MAMGIYSVLRLVIHTGLGLLFIINIQQAQGPCGSM